MTPRRVDRNAVAARMPQTPRWIVEDLLDAFEPAALTAAAKADEKRPPHPPRGEGERAAPITADDWSDE